MKRGTKIAIAVVACLAIWFVFAIANAAAGNNHGGGILVMMIMFSIIAFVWRKIVGKKDDEEPITKNDGMGSEYQPSQKWNNAVSGFNEQEHVKTVKLVQDGIEVSMSLPSHVIEQMESLKKQDPNKWVNKEVDLVREAKRVAGSAVAKTVEVKEEETVGATDDFTKQITGNESVKPIENTEATESQSAIDTIEESRDDQPVEEMTVPIVLNKEEYKQSDGLFGNKLESEYRRESKAESHWIRQDDTEICINIEEEVYRKMVELQSENPKKWVNKELDLFKKAKSLLIEQKTPKKTFFGKKRND